MTTYRIRGLESILANLAMFPKEFQQQALAPALRAGAEAFRDEAKVQAPRKTGNLIANIAITQDKKPHIAGMDSRFIVYVKYKGKTAAAYWRYQEFGTSMQSPQPFMRPAFEIKSAEALGLILQSLAASVPKIAANFRK